MKKTIPDINEVVSFLDRNDAPKLEQLRKKFPQFSEELEIGDILGEDDDIKKEEFTFRLEVATAGLTAIQNKAIENLEALKQKVRSLNNVQLTGQVIVLISGAAILGMIEKDLGKEWTWLKYLAPSLVLLSSILTLWAKNRSELIFSPGKTINDSVGELITLKNQSIQIIGEIGIVMKYFDLENAKILISSANETARKMNDLIEKIS